VSIFKEVISVTAKLDSLVVSAKQVGEIYFFVFALNERKAKKIKGSPQNRFLWF